MLAHHSPTVVPFFKQPIRSLASVAADSAAVTPRCSSLGSTVVRPALEAITEPRFEVIRGTGVLLSRFPVANCNWKGLKLTCSRKLQLEGAEADLLL